jgi:hypothetical protein
MSVDKFGRYSESGTRSGSFGKRGGVGLPLTSDGDYDMSNKRLKFVNDPKDDNDAINLKTLKSETSSSLTLQNNVYNARFHKIVNIPKPLDRYDSVNKEYLIWHINHTLNFNNIKKEFDAKNLKIINLADPVDDQDSVTKKYLHSVIPEKTDKFSFYNFVIHDIGDPQDMRDAVNLQYITDHCITYDIDKIDCKNKVLTNVKDGTAKSDAATISQITKLNNEKWDEIKENCITYGHRIDNHDTLFIAGKTEVKCWDAKGFRIVNLPRGKNKHDCAIVEQVPDTDGHVWNFRNRRLTNVFPAKEDYDCVVKGQTITLAHTDETNVQAATFDGRNKRISNIADPKELNDVVNVNFIVRVLSEMFFNFYNDLTTNKINQSKKDNWIRSNIVDKYFIHPKSKLLRNANDLGKAVD